MYNLYTIHICISGTPIHECRKYVEVESRYVAKWYFLCIIIQNIPSSSPYNIIVACMPDLPDAS